MIRKNGSLHPGFIIPLLLSILLLVGFLLVPFVSMLLHSFQGADGGKPGFSNYMKALTSPFYYRSFQNSFLVALLSTILGLAIGLVSSASIHALSVPLQNKIILIAGMSSNFAGVPLAFGYIILLGANGIFTLLFQRMGIPVLKDFDLYSWAGLSLVYVYFQLPLSVLLLLPAFAGLKNEWREAANLLGANDKKFWRHIAFPVLAPSVFGTGGILFANALGAYATAYALIGSNFSLVPIRISGLVASNVALQPELGSALAVLLTLMMGSAIALNQWLQSRYRKFAS